VNLETNQSKSDVTPAAHEEPVSVKSAPPGTGTVRTRLKGLLVFAVVLILCFGKPLLNLITYAAPSELYSHILLIPFVTAYLIWIKRGELPLSPVSGGKWAVLPLLAGVLTMAVYRWEMWKGVSLDPANWLFLTTLSFLLFLVGGTIAFLGTALVRAIAFPIAFLFFFVPFPTVVRHGIETFFQHGSADAAYLLLTVSGMPVFRAGTQFTLPSYSLNVAPECSGIHSSLVLLITSLLAAYLFLKSPSKRILFVIAVIPLALLRNGFRIFVIAQLCVHIGPHMIESPIHRRGGPIFFGLSLIPLFFLLSYLKKREQRKNEATPIKK
jgi:exosortase C (VPDSG-CTERM-specific)